MTVRFETTPKGEVAILPRAEWESLLLPTPMAVSQSELPIAALVYDCEGSEVARVPLGRLPREHATALSLDTISGGLGNSPGHVELVYDFANGGSAVEWTKILDGVLGLDFEQAIPGRGEPKSRAERIGSTARQSPNLRACCGSSFAWTSNRSNARAR